MGNEVNYLYEPEGSELHWDGLQKATPPQEQHASLSGPSNPMGRSPSVAVHPDDRSGMMGTAAAQARPAVPAPAPKATRAPTNDELMAQALAMIESQKVQHAALGGSSLHQRDDSGQQLPQWLSEEMSRNER